MDRLLKVLTGDLSGNKTHAPLLLIGNEANKRVGRELRVRKPGQDHSTNRPRQWRRHPLIPVAAVASLDLRQLTKAGGRPRGFIQPARALCARCRGVVTALTGHVLI